ncbi:Galactoside 2-alpha-L-fucosyltransferase 1, partial [Lamellibrachia satsuma]
NGNMSKPLILGTMESFNGNMSKPLILGTMGSYSPGLVRAVAVSVCVFFFVGYIATYDRNPGSIHLSDSSWLSGQPTQNVLTDVPLSYTVYQRGPGGRLGNCMFQYASLYGIARINNRSPVINTRLYNGLWDVFSNLTIPRKARSNGTFMREKRYGTYDPGFENLPDSDVLLRGYLQSWKYFQRYASEIRQQFAFKDSVLAEARDYLVSTSRRYKVSPAAGSITLVGVHIRRGDRTTARLSRYYRVAGKSYIVKAMNDFRRNYTRVHFVVCSDDIPWCKEHLGRQKNVSFSEGKTHIIDFAILSLCNHTLTTVGTFGWWAAWLAGGTTTYYANPAKKLTSVYKGLTNADHYLPKWIPMSD